MHPHLRIVRVRITVPESAKANSGRTGFAAEFVTLAQAIPSLQYQCSVEGWTLAYNATEEILTPSVIVNRAKEMGRRNA